MKETKKGGQRANSGRKPSEDKKIPITVYIKESKVQKNGGKITLAQRIVEVVEVDFMTNPIEEKVAENNKPKNKARILKERQASVSVKNLSNPLDNESVDTMPKGLNLMQQLEWREKQINKLL